MAKRSRKKTKPIVDEIVSQETMAPDVLPNEDTASDPVIEIPFDDGSVVIDFSPVVGGGEGDSKEHEANLALSIDEGTLHDLAQDLLEGIKADEDSRAEWMASRARGIDLLGIKIEDPKSGTGVSSAPLEGMSVVRDPVLLEAVLRFQANAQGELLPSAGPAKVVNYGGTAESEALADALERDLNYYLTSIATEYYPDSRRMFFWTGFSGMAFKKVYRCPLRRRPVSESVDAADLVVSDAVTDLRNASRITHIINMRPSVMKRMQIEGVYRKTELTQPTPEPNAVQEKIANIQGVAPKSERPQDQAYTVYECYCELDIPGFEHEIDGEETGLPLPYRVSIDKDSEKILEIRRNWKEEDADTKAKIPFVVFGYVPGLGFYNLGLLHILGNLTNALTALTREAIDSGMFANFPGFLVSKSSQRQMTNEFRIPPGGGLPIDTQGLPINQVVMGLPYKEVGGSHINLMSSLREVAQRLGGTADTPVGEGKQDAPVGTTMAMIEQATKIEGAVHKALHQAQSEEFQLLCELFKEDPEALWRGNRRPALANQVEQLRAALDNVDIVPAADPNVPSHIHRVMKAAAIKQLSQANPEMYNQVAVDSRILSMLNVDRPEDLFVPPQPPAPPMPTPDTLVLAEVKKGDQALKAQEIQLKAAQIAAEQKQKNEDRQAKENIEVLKLAAQLATRAHPEADAVVAKELAQSAPEPLPLRPPPGAGGSVRAAAPTPQLPPRPIPVQGLGGLTNVNPQAPQGPLPRPPFFQGVLRQ